MVRHTGSRVPADLAFFASPSPEIGQIYSADSDLTDPPQPLQFWKTIAWIMFFSVGTGIIIALTTETIWLVPIMAVLGILLLWFIAKTWCYTCSFVGSLGVTKSTVKRFNSGKPKVETLLFKEAVSLFTSQTQKYVNGAYTGTEYKYIWGLANSSPYTISGTYRSKEGRPPEGDPYYLAAAAEAAWTRHLLPLAMEDFKAAGHVSFPMSGKLQMIQISDGALDFIMKNGETKSTAVADMKDIKLSQGRFYFKHKDSTWWSGKGKYDFCLSGHSQRQTIYDLPG